MHTGARWRATSAAPASRSPRATGDGRAVLSPQRMRVLLEVVRGDGVVGAARALHLTPQAVSQQLGLLERELGVPLFDRTRRRLVATELARDLARHAERIEAELVAAERTAASATDRATGTVRLAAFHTAIRWLVVEALPLVRARQPGVTPLVIEMSGAGVIAGLRARSLDLVIDDRDEATPPPHSPTIASRLLLREPYFIVAPAGTARTLRTLRQLASQRWIDAPADTACHAALRRLAARGRFEPQVSHICLELPTVLALVRAGEGIAIVPSLALGDAAAIATCPIPRLGMRHLYLLQRTTSRGTEPAVDAVAEALLGLRR